MTGRSKGSRTSLSIISALHANLALPLTFIAQDPHWPALHEYRYAISASYFLFICANASKTFIFSISSIS